MFLNWREFFVKTNDPLQAAYELLENHRDLCGLVFELFDAGVSFEVYHSKLGAWLGAVLNELKLPFTYVYDKGNSPSFIREQLQGYVWICCPEGEWVIPRQEGWIVAPYAPMACANYMKATLHVGAKSGKTVLVIRGSDSTACGSDRDQIDAAIRRMGA